MTYNVKTKVVTTIDVEFDRFSIGSRFADKIFPHVERASISGYSKGDTFGATVTLYPHEGSDIPSLLWLIDVFAKQAVEEAR
jgi:hypothetical protein